jgi:starch synthase (maltosyl-transferring)
VNTRPEDWERTDIDVTSFIREVNAVKSSHPVFQEDGPTHMLHHASNQILLMWKASIATREESLFALNKDICSHQHFYAENLRNYTQAGGALSDVSPTGGLEYISSPFNYSLRPGQGIVLTTSRDELRED